MSGKIPWGVGLSLTSGGQFTLAADLPDHSYF